MLPSYVHTASVPKTFLDKRRELIFNLRVINGGGPTSPVLLINEGKDYIVFGQDRIVLKPARE